MKRKKNIYLLLPSLALRLAAILSSSSNLCFSASSEAIRCFSFKVNTMNSIKLSIFSFFYFYFYFFLKKYKNLPIIAAFCFLLLSSSIIFASSSFLCFSAAASLAFLSFSSRILASLAFLSSSSLCKSCDVSLTTYIIIIKKDFEKFLILKPSGEDTNQLLILNDNKINEIN